LHKMQDISQLGEVLLASQEGPCFTEFVSWVSYLRQVMEGNGHCQIWGTISALAWWNWEKPRNFCSKESVSGLTFEPLTPWQ
jgi:hypothetical protein